MSLLQALFLGIIQGITEFLPISSSGHLKLGEILLGLNHLDKYIPFDLICHVGTLIAIFAVLYKEIWEVITKDRKMFGMLALATLPLAPLYFILSGIKSIYGVPQYLGYFFLVSALFLFLGEHFAKETLSTKKRFRDALFIGIAQAIAILPAVSRSGATIATARFLGWEREKAARFSFFLAIPTILGGIVIEGREISKSEGTDISFTAYLIGFLSAFLVGIVVLKALLKLLRTVTLKPFAYYCLIIGLFTIIYTSIL